MESNNKRYVFTLGALSLVYVVLGLTLLIQPAALQVILCYVLGIAAAAVGIIRIVWHFLKRDPADVSRSDIPVGVLLIAGGAYMTVFWETVWAALPVVLGFAVLFDSVLKMQHAVELRALRSSNWGVVLLLGFATAVLGVLLALSGAIMDAAVAEIFFGISLMADGAVNIAVLMLLMVKWRNAAKAQAAQPPMVPPDIRAD